jgi:hypothetical protein
MKKSDLVEIKKNNVGKGLLIENDGYMSISDKQTQYIKESLGNGEWHCPYPFVVDAVFQKFGIKNANGRIYPEGILKKQVALYQQRIQEKRALGECNHPSDSTVDLGRISHNIIELHWEGRTLVGKLELNVTQGFVKYGIASSYGDTIANLLLNGYKIGVSSRGVGSVEQKMGQYIVGDDFELICWDIVESPSTPNAYIGFSREELQPYLESKDYSNNNVINEKINKIKSILGQ